MRTLYFDCFAGISGDMVLGALLDVGLDLDFLRGELGKLQVSPFSLEVTREDRSGISAQRVRVLTEAEHHHRHLPDILTIISGSALSETVKERAARIFRSLAEAEARVHNLPVERIHFHEVGAVDAIVDIVGACIGFENLGIEKFYCSPLHVGSGVVEMAHGRFPVPPPAVAELLKGAPIYSTDIVGELVTPTGAAIVSTLCERFGPIPALKIERMGYGAGGRSYKGFPNALRVLLGTIENGPEHLLTEKLILLETNIDDMSPQVAGYLLDRAIERGALDCFLSPVQMKKNRPGVLVSILCKPGDREQLTELLLTETTTLGVRAQQIERVSLPREMFTVETSFGRIAVKAARLSHGQLKLMPEFEDCRAAAERHDKPLREVWAAAIAAAESTVRT
jgi:hypothetical protein